MTQHVLIIMGGVILAIIAFGVLTNLAGGSGPWKQLVARYPAQSEDPDATRGEMRIFLGREAESDRLGAPRGCIGWLMPWTWFAGMQQVRYAIDDEHLHLRSEGGALAPSGAMSLPWANIELGHRAAGHMGEHIELRIDEMLALVPTSAIGRELEVRELYAHTPDEQTMTAEQENAHHDASTDDVIRRMIADGETFKQARKVDFHLLFRDELSARQAGSRLASDFQVNIEEGLDADPSRRWEVDLVRVMIPKPDEVKAIERNLRALAHELGGEYDGWGSPAMGDPEPFG